MNNRRLEQLSAMKDGHLTEWECCQLMDESIADPEWKATWWRYHLIGDALRDSLPDRIYPGFTKRVNLALENEPVIRTPPWRRVLGLKPVLGFALTAAVTVAIGLSVYIRGADILEKRPGSPAETRTVQTEVETPIAPLPIATVRWNSEPPKRPPRLNSYLVNHNQFKAEINMQAVSPYYRIIGYETSP